MKSAISVFIILFITIGFLNGQVINPGWKIDEKNAQNLRAEKESSGIPENSAVYSIDFSALFSILTSMPENDLTIREIILPVGDHFENFELIPSSVMQPGLQARFPEYRTFRCQSLDNPNVQARIGITPFGFHGIIAQGEADYLIEPFTVGGETYCAVFNNMDGLRAFPSNSTYFCGSDLHKHPEEVTPESLEPFTSIRSTEKKMRHFKLGIACTSSFASDVGATTEQVMNKVVTVINQVNLRYNIDLGMHFDLIDKLTTLFNLSSQSDYFTVQNNGGQLLGQSQAFFGEKLFPADYDFGQTWTTSCTDVGGVVSGSACEFTSKARGVSCGPNNVSYFLTTVKHEMGHQFSGSHTFSSCNGSSQLASNGAYEPGSGSTILSYAGGCGPDNITGSASDYFHVINIIQMTNHLAAYADCGTYGEGINHTPDPILPVYKETVLTIPANTPYELVGTATDPDNDNLIYNWEQFDLGNGEPLGTNEEVGPLNRSFTPTADGFYRMIPTIQNLISDNEDISNRLPKVTREMNWKFNVRDQNEHAGSTISSDFKFKVDGEAGPFGFTFPASGIDTIFETGQYVELTWDVANTDNEKVNAKYVNIFYSTDGGYDFTDTLLMQTPNDGREHVVIKKTTVNNRFKIKGDGSIFFNISNKSIRSIEPAAPGYSYDVYPHNAVMCSTNEEKFVIKSFGWKEFTEPISLELVDGWPANTALSLDKSVILPGEEAVLTVNVDEVTESGWFRIRIKAESAGQDPQYRYLDLEILGSELDFEGAVSPVDGQTNTTQVPQFEWTPIPGADVYFFEVSSSPKFEQGTILDSYTGPGTSFNTEKVYPAGTIIYWRVRANNRCLEGNWSAINSFQTELFQCNAISGLNLPKSISSNTSVPPVEVNFSLANTTGAVGDVNVKNLNLDHQDLSRIEILVKAPTGEEVILLADKCFSKSDIRASFDDQSPLDIDCNRIKNNLTFKPVESLDVFNGLDVSGTWSFIIKTVAGGAIGQLNAIELDLCASVDGSVIEKVNNEIIKVKKGHNQVVENKDLLYVSSKDDDVEYVLLSAPAHGQLIYSGQSITIGQSFHQEGVNSWDFVYSPNNPDYEGADEFWVAVKDEFFGFKSPELIKVDINDAHTVGTKEREDYSAQMTVYPNPTNGHVNIIVPEHILNSGTQLIIRDLQGRIINTETLSGFNHFIQADLNQSAPGIYMIELVNARYKAVKKLVKL